MHHYQSTGCFNETLVRFRQLVWGEMGGNTANSAGGNFDHWTTVSIHEMGHWHRCFVVMLNSENFSVGTGIEIPGISPVPILFSLK